MLRRLRSGARRRRMTKRLRRMRRRRLRLLRLRLRGETRVRIASEVRKIRRRRRTRRQRRRLPIFTKNPAYEDLDLPLFRDKFGFAWVPDEASYYLMRDTLASRITTELPAATYLDVWSSSFNHIGDGIRPDAASVQAAAIAILVSVYF